VNSIGLKLKTISEQSIFVKQLETNSPVMKEQDIPTLNIWFWKAEKMSVGT